MISSLFFMPNAEKRSGRRLAFGLRREKSATIEEYLWMLQLHARRDSASRPVLHALDAAKLLVAKQFGDLRRAAETLDQFTVRAHICITCHALSRELNATFRRLSIATFNNGAFTCGTMRP